jgi:transposase InsO family protein
VDRSTRPRSSPNQICGQVEEAIVRLRKELADAGLDHGATTIHWHLCRDRSLVTVPSVAGIHRVLGRRGLVVPQPSKRPKSSWQRFEAAAPNERWQIDAMDWEIASGLVRVFNIIDDHSRVATRSRAVPEATTDAAWDTFTQAAAVWGLPAGVLSDNGLCFSGKLRGFEVLFEANLRDVGIRPATGRPYHPQTTGKVERFQQTLKKWLRTQPTATTITELQTQLDTFVDIYNHHRPHRSLPHRSTPAVAYQARPKAEPGNDHPDSESRIRRDHIHSGKHQPAVDGHMHHIGVGRNLDGTPVLLHINGNNVRDIHATAGEVIRTLTINPTRRYHGTGNPTGGPTGPRKINRSGP